MIETRGGTPIRIKQVATVGIGAKPRLGQVGLDDKDDVVQGIVVMLRGQDPGAVIKLVKEKITELNERILPEGVEVISFLDRTTLVQTYS